MWGTTRDQINVFFLLGYVISRIQFVSERFHITIGELNTGRSCTHRGIVFDLDADAIALSPSLAAKLLRRINLIHVGLPLTKLQVESLLSSITYADSILRIRPARPCFHMVHYLRAISYEKTATRRVSPALNAEIRGAALWLTSSTPLSAWAVHTPTGFTFTDASKQAGALVRYTATETTATTFSIWPKQFPFVISRDELAMLMHALQCYPKRARKAKPPRF